jgi:hypothetical protein
MLLLAVMVLAQAPAAQTLAAQTPADQTPAAPSSPSSQIAFRSSGTMGELMVNIIYPTSDAIFYISTRTPSKPEEWIDLQSKAMMLAESANLLMMPRRARDHDRWMKDANLLLDVGIAAFRAAKAKDVEALTALNDQLYAACVTCHADYRPNYRPRLPAPQTPSP